MKVKMAVGGVKTAVGRAQPTEAQEQIAVVSWLKRQGVFHAHVPSGSRRPKKEQAQLKAMGLIPGVPDLLIFDHPGVPRYVATAVEMKRRRGGRVSQAQKEVMARLESLGWKCLVARGAEDAITQLQELGYGRES